jgi:hypothetical protein
MSVHGFDLYSTANQNHRTLRLSKSQITVTMNNLTVTLTVTVRLIKVYENTVKLAQQ